MNSLERDSWHGGKIGFTDLHNNGRVSGGGVTNFDYPDEQNIQEVENLYQKAEMCVCGSNYT